MATIKIELGHTLEEWEKTYSDNENLWDVNLDDVLNGALEPNEDIVYWYIDGRLYETN